MTSKNVNRPGKLNKNHTLIPINNTETIEMITVFLQNKIVFFCIHLILFFHENANRLHYNETLYNMFCRAFNRRRESSQKHIL